MPTTTDRSDPLLAVTDLTTEFPAGGTPFRAVDNVSFTIAAGERVALVGESGSGKSLTVRSVLGLVPRPARIVKGSVVFRGRNLVGLQSRELARIRGAEIALIFQDPMTSWNPVKRVGWQIREAMKLHQQGTRSSFLSRTIELLRRVGIPSPAERARAYPHQFSGGMRQRGMIAMGLANDPALLIADEPTTALDVTVQDQIIRLLRELGDTSGTAILLITHNLALVASLCDRVIVMYAGQIVETASTEALFSDPQHPYSFGLLRSIPHMNQAKGERLVGIPGQPLQSGAAVVGCRYEPRCPFKVARCATEEPPLAEIAPGRSARCWVLMRNVKEAA